MENRIKNTVYELERKGGATDYALKSIEFAIRDEYEKRDEIIQNESCTIEDIVKSFALVVEFHSRLDKLTKSLSKLVNGYKEATIPDLILEKHGQKNGEAIGYGKVNIMLKEAMNVKAENRQEAIEWLKNNGLGDFVSETLTADSLKELLVDDDHRDSLPPIFEIKDRITSRFTKGNELIKV